MKKITYTCNICGSEITYPSDSFGVSLTVDNKPVLVDYVKVNAVHMHYSCAHALKEQICLPENSAKIEDYLGRPF